MPFQSDAPEGSDTFRWPVWGDIEWAIELLYNSVKTGNQSVWRPDPLVTRCGKGSQHPAESWAPRPPG